MGYNMIKPDAISNTYHNSIIETCRQKHKMSSKYVLEVDYLLEDDSLGLEAKTLLQESFAVEVGVKISRNVICKIMKATLGYGKRLAYVKRHRSDGSKEHRVEYAT